MDHVLIAARVIDATTIVATFDGEVTGVTNGDAAWIATDDFGTHGSIDANFGGDLEPNEAQFTFAEPFSGTVTTFEYGDPSGGADFADSLPLRLPTSTAVTNPP